MIFQHDPAAAGTDDKMRNYGHLSRRDNRTQPGVLTPGSVKKARRPERAEDISSASRSPARGSGTTICRPFRARSPWMSNPRLKPRAESYRPFETSSMTRVSRIQNLSFVLCHLSFGLVRRLPDEFDL